MGRGDGADVPDREHSLSITKTPLRVAVATDRGYLLQTAILIHSLRRHHEAGSLQILLLHDRLKGPEIDALRTLAAGAELLVHDVAHPLDGVRRGRLARPSFFRLLLPDVCPPDWEHVLYLDVDMLVEAPLDDLWELRHSSSPAAMVLEYGGPHFGAPKGPPWRDLGVDPATPYFNSGVMLSDLPTWRAENVGHQALELLRAFDLPHGDQCALNTVLARRIRPLEPQWNVTTAYFKDHNHLGIERGVEEMDRIRTAPAIVHFNLGWTPRPWEPRSEHPHQERWTAARDEVLQLVPALTPPAVKTPRRITSVAIRSARHLLRRVLRSRD